MFNDSISYNKHTSTSLTWQWIDIGWIIGEFSYCEHKIALSEKFISKDIDNALSERIY